MDKMQNVINMLNEAMIVAAGFGNLTLVENAGKRMQVLINEKKKLEGV